MTNKTQRILFIFTHPYAPLLISLIVSKSFSRGFLLSLSDALECFKTNRGKLVTPDNNTRVVQFQKNFKACMNTCWQLLKSNVALPWNYAVINEGIILEFKKKQLASLTIGRSIWKPYIVKHLFPFWSKAQPQIFSVHLTNPL